MFSTLESKWNHSARRGWTTPASFGFQAMALSLLLLIPLLTIQGPPRLEWFSRLPVPVPSPPVPTPPENTQRPIHSSNITQGLLLQPVIFPRNIANPDERPIASSPDVSAIDAIGPGFNRRGVYGSTGLSSIDIVPHLLLPRPLAHLSCRTGQKAISFIAYSLFTLRWHDRHVFKGASNCGRSSAGRGRSKTWLWSADTPCFRLRRLRRYGNGATALIF